jgi:uncharacterized protein (DUF2141 family)
MQRLKTFLAILVAFTTNGGTMIAQDGILRVRMTGLENQNGKVVVQLFDSGEGFPTKPAKALRTSTTLIVGDSAFVEFSGLPFQHYAVSAYHDENGNGKLDTNFLGIPSEPVAASNNAKGNFGPPSFDDAKILLDAPRKQITITFK